MSLIIGSGIDIVYIPALQKIWDKHGLSFCKKILTEEEILLWSDACNPLLFLAGRYASKEAAFKAFCSLSKQKVSLGLRDFYILKTPWGAPKLLFSSKAWAYLPQTPKILIEWSVSISHHQNYCISSIFWINREKI